MHGHAEFKAKPCRSSERRYRQSMCGRYRLKDPKRAIDDIGDREFSEVRLTPRFNIAPTQRVFILAGDGKPEEMTWGLVPPWASDTSKAIINAMSETVREKRTFKRAIAERRCILPADGFYEWKKQPVGPKIPHLFTIRGELPFYFAGIWEPGADGNRCCILTTAPNEVCSPDHNRMPVMLSREQSQYWLRPGELRGDDFDRLTSPFPSADMEAIAVSTAVSNARYDGPKCNDPWEGSTPPTKLTITKKQAGSEQATFGF
jgi:putative SOS response-associated peptidase YedK